MNPSISFDRPMPWLAQEALSLGAGALFTLALFAAMAHLDLRQPPPMQGDTAELEIVSLPFESPPPRPTETTPAVEVGAAPLAGIEGGSSDSPVTIAVVPPDLASLLPATDIPPTASVQIGFRYSDLKPRIEYEVDPEHVYQRSEVDRPPTVLSRGLPAIPKWVRDNADVLRVTLLIVIGTKGDVTSVRLYKSSGNPDFDRIVMESVKETWVFTPAVKAGRNVRCLAQQAVTVKWSGGSPFEM